MSRRYAESARALLKYYELKPAVCQLFAELEAFIAQYHGSKKGKELLSRSRVMRRRLHQKIDVAP